MIRAGLAIWILCASLYVLRSPQGAFAHDFRGHVEHTRIIYSERRLALPREGWETYQPPLYYLLMCTLSPLGRAHVLWVRWVSILFGALCLHLINRMLMQNGASPETRALVLLFIGTTPSFLFLFTTYNNDPLAVLLAIAILVAAQEWVERGGRPLLVSLGVLATLGLYTKLSVLYPLAALAIVMGVLAVARRIPLDRVWPVAGVLCISFLLFAPWLVFHNYRLTGRLAPSPTDLPIPLSDSVRLPASPWKTIVTPPGWSPGEWRDPFAHVWEPVNHKKNSFLAYVFVTSIFGEFTLGFLPTAISWAILLLHLLLTAAALIAARKSPAGLQSLSLIVLGTFLSGTLILRAPYATLMDFRYIAWVWLPAALLYALSLNGGAPFAKRTAWPSFLRGCMAAGIFLQGVAWCALIVGGQWNIPLQ